MALVHRLYGLCKVSELVIGRYLLLMKCKSIQQLLMKCRSITNDAQVKMFIHKTVK